VPGRQLESWQDEAASLYDRGFRAMKLRLGTEEAPLEAANAESLRSAVPDDLELMGDGNGGFGPTNARSMGRALDELGFVWFEEPMPPLEGYAGYPELAAELEIPLAGGELTQSRREAVALLSAHAVDIVQPDPTTCGGIGETLFIAALASQYRILSVPHTSGGQIGVAAGVQAMACLPDQTVANRNTLLYLEYPALELAAELAIVVSPLVPVDGLVPVPGGPGLGIDIDDAALERIAVERFTIS
jgi:D-galactarolactone cycloisomerase